LKDWLGCFLNSETKRNGMTTE